MKPLPRFIILYAMMYAAGGVASPFWPLFFQSRGAAAEQIGLVIGLGIVGRLVAGPAVGRAADMLAALRAVLAVCAALAACIGATGARADDDCTGRGSLRLVNGKIHTMDKQDTVVSTVLIKVSPIGR